MFARQWTSLLCEGLAGQRTLPRRCSSYRAHAIRSFSASTALFKNYNKPRNQAIKFPVVQLVDGENRLCPPEPLESILKRVKLRTHFVELVQEDPPLVKIMDKEVANAARKAAKERSRVTKMERKEIQLTWNVADSDLNHKIMKAREQLERNNLVDIAFAPKAKQRLPPEQTMKEKMQKVVVALHDIGTERQERTFERGVGVIFLRSTKSIEQNE